MIKSELVQRIYEQNPHLYQRDVENIVNAILGEIIAAMARGDRVELRGFGAFSVKQRPARTGRNPRTGAHVSVVHTSCAEALAAARRARERGVHLWVETVVPYLVLDKTYAERPDFEGAKYVMSPPLRERRHQDALWKALAAGQIDTVATDHAPFDFRGQKEMRR